MRWNDLTAKGSEVNIICDRNYYGKYRYGCIDICIIVNKIKVIIIKIKIRSTILSIM